METHVVNKNKVAGKIQLFFSAKIDRFMRILCETLENVNRKSIMKHINAFEHNTYWGRN